MVSFALAAALALAGQTTSPSPLQSEAPKAETPDIATLRAEFVKQVAASIDAGNVDGHLKPGETRASVKADVARVMASGDFDPYLISQYELAREGEEIQARINAWEAKAKAAPKPPLVFQPKPQTASRTPAKPQTSTPRPSALERRKAGRAAYNARVAREQAAQQQAAARQYQQNLPYLLEAQKQQLDANLRLYEANTRFRSDMDFNDAIRSVNRPFR